MFCFFVEDDFDDDFLVDGFLVMLCEWFFSGWLSCWIFSRYFIDDF